jgi:hypothetical protein
MTTVLDPHFPTPPANIGILMLDGAIAMYADTLRYLAYEMKREGIKVKLVGCAGGLSTCISLRSNFQGKPLSAEKRAETCRACQKAQTELGASSRRVFEPELDAASAALLKDVESKLREEDTLERVVEGPDADDICKIAFFDFSVSHKINLSIRLSAEQKADFLDEVTDLLALRRYLEKVAASQSLDALLYINGNYSQNQLAFRVFARHGTPCLSVEPQITSSSARNAVMLVPERIKLLPTALAGIDENRPLSANDFSGVLAHFLARIAGNEFNAYTRLSADHASLTESRAIKDFFDRYGDVRTFFLSSEDELYAHEVVFGLSLGPESQFELLRRFLAAAALHPGIGFVVRLHPRMAANKRNHFFSSEHTRYAELLSQQRVPDNVLVLLGDCPISSYYIASKSSLVIVSWSTIGLETLLLGRPTIALFPERLMYPIIAFNGQPMDRAEIFALAFAKKIEVLVRTIPLLNWVAYAYQRQFTPVPVPRSSNPYFSSRLYTWAFNRAKRYGLLHLWFRGDRTWLSLRRTLTHRLAIDAVKMHKLARYRQTAGALFRHYGENLGISGQP